jgi:transcriptional regulator with XRE-family HTH domain
MGAESTTRAQVGKRLRSIRQQKGLTLHDVEALSPTEFKASVLGAYERGERAISVHRLLRLAEIYQVPRDHLLPQDTGVKVDLVQRDKALDTPARFRSRADVPETAARAFRPGTGRDL